MYSRRELFLRHLAQTSPSPPMLDIERAEGVFLFDQNGKKYTDLISGIAVSSLGHKHPVIQKAVIDQVERHMHLMVYGEFIISPQQELASRLASLLPPSLDSVYFTNSGAEAVEGAMKLAKRLTGRTGIASFRNSYHGSTQGALSICGNEELKNAFRPLLPGHRMLEYNDENSLQQIDDSLAAVFIEPIQAEAGVILPHHGFLEKVKSRCEATGTLLVFDEIQTGMGRTGKLFAFLEHGITPDVLLLGKAFGGGMPLAAFISSHENMSALTHHPVLGHLTTFGGHPVSCAAAMASLNFIVGNNLAVDTLRKEKLFRENLKHPSIIEIRGRGLMLSLKFSSEKFNQDVILKCYDKGLITDWFLFAPDCLRIAPPLIISDEEIADACTKLTAAIEEVTIK
ncbi:MAG: aminotransferase class III-fold pyridoxal phosphate-dependent enzyme [Bacteroidia bacterium]